MGVLSLMPIRSLAYPAEAITCKPPAIPLTNATEKGFRKFARQAWDEAP